MKFKGYLRKDGKVGIRNHVVVMPGVICAEIAAKKIAAACDAVFLPNPVGCGLNPKDMVVMMDVLSGILANANVYGVLIVGLGCEFIKEEQYREEIWKKSEKPVHYVGIQAEGGLGKTIEKGSVLVRQLQQEAAAVLRTEADLSDLILGLECGGSDPTSGFSSNTVLGLVTDEVIDAGGTAILSETAEAIGAEHILRKSGRTPEIGEQIYQAIIDWERNRYAESGQDVRCGNPSPGNMAGGITTLTEKSLGCIHKAGSRPFDGCYEYGQWIDKKGLYFVNAAASDVLNVTALVAAGATLVAFTTGLGNPIGNPVTPVIKITGNHDTAQALYEIIDVDTSASIRGEKTLEELKEEMLSCFQEVMNGRQTRAEENGAVEISINQSYSYA